MTNRNTPVRNPLEAIAGLTAAAPPNAAQGVGQYITAAMLAAAAGKCRCETCRLMCHAGELMRMGLAPEDTDG